MIINLSTVFKISKIPFITGNDTDTKVHYLLHYPNFSDEKLIFINKIRNIDNGILNLSDSII